MSAWPSTVGRFRVHRRLDVRAHGGVTPVDAWEHGDLLSATDGDTGDPVTLRVFDRPDAATEPHVRGLTNALTGLRLPDVVAPLAGGIDGPHAWWLYPRADIETLAVHLGRGLTTPLDSRVENLVRMLRGAAAVRGAGLGRLDVSPHGIWLSELDAPWSFAGIDPDWPIAPPPASAAGGTRRYDAPEPPAGRDERALVYIAGLTIVEVMTGRHPMDDVLPGAWRPGLPAELGPEPAAADALPPGSWSRLATVVARALAATPADRWPTLAALATALEDCLQADPPRVPSPPDGPTRLPVYDDNVQFTLYRPRTVAVETWQTLLFFAHLEALPLDAAPGTPDPVAEVARQAAVLLGDPRHHGRQTVDSNHTVPREGLLVVVPHAEGVEFNPPTAAFQWLEPVHREEFRLRASAATAGTTVRGRVTVFLGSIILAELPLTIIVGTTAEAAAAPVEPQAARPYRHIFASYSHLDQPIVEEFSRYASAIGDRYVRDVVQLRSGEVWSETLEALIRRADVFQLFWSWNAMRSPHVQAEWQYALGLDRATFVRPVYWDDPLPADAERPSAALRALHFERIRPASAAVGGAPPIAAASPAAADERDTTATFSWPAPTASGNRPPRSRWLLRSAGSLAAAVLVMALLLPVARTRLREAAATWSGSARDAIGSGPAGATGTTPAESQPAEPDGSEPTPTTAPTTTAPPSPSPSPGAAPMPSPAPPLPNAATRPTAVPAPSGRLATITVVDATGAPVARAAVSIRPVTGAGRTLRLTTDLRGRVRARIDGGLSYEVSVDAQANTRTRVLPAGPGDIEILMSPGSR